MKTIHKFLLTSAMAVSLLPLAAADCAGVEVTCVDDTECIAPETCNTILGVCEAPAGEGEGEGEGEGDVGEGEGEGEGEDCAAVDEFDDAAGTGLVLEDGEIEEAELTPDSLDCGPVNGGTLFDVTALLSGDYNVPAADAEDGNDVEFAFAGSAPTSCSSFPTFANLDDFGDCAAPAECLVYCPICIVDDANADDVALQVIDEDGELSNALCLERV